MINTALPVMHGASVIADQRLWERSLGNSTASVSPAFADLVLGDAQIASVVQRLQRAAQSNLPILLQGETGTGKELFARAIHEASPRRHGPFVAVNCAAIPEGLIESELFGYRAGSFTGASTRGAKGLIQQAHGGTLFLDEIGDMPLAMQSRLLRVLAEKEVTPVGSDVPLKTDFRVVSATHRDLRARAHSGEFREDLMFRLQGLTVTLPVLRQRSDIAELAQRLLTEEQASVGRALSLAPCAIRLISDMSWPGNVRQLKQVLTTAAWLCDVSSIQASDIEMALEPGSSDASFCGSMAGTGYLHDSSSMAEAGQGGEAHDCDPLQAAAGDDRSMLLYSLKRNRWNIALTAREFQTARTTIYRRMTRYGIVQPHLLEE